MFVKSVHKPKPHCITAGDRDYVLPKARSILEACAAAVADARDDDRIRQWRLEKAREAAHKAAMLAGEILDEDLACADIGRAFNTDKDSWTPSYAYPSAGQVALLRQHGAHRLIECGAGSGLYASTLNRHGFDVIASDRMPDADHTGRSLEYRFQFATYAPLLLMDGRAAVEAHPDRDVLIIMPNPEDIWVADTVLGITTPGRRLYILPDCSDFLDEEGVKLWSERYSGIALLRHALRDRFRLLGFHPLAPRGFGPRRPTNALCAFQRV